MIKIFKNVYVIVGIIVFLFMFVLGIWIGFPLVESALASVVLTVVGVGTIWWRKEIW